MLESLNQQAPDGIIKLIQEFKSDPRERKIDLGVGVYRNASGVTPVMRAVKRAEKMLWERETTKTYTGIVGDPGFHGAMAELVLADTVDAERIAAAHTPGGTGAVRQALELIRRASPDASVWISVPSWPNHRSIVNYLAIDGKEYRYFDHATRSVDFESMIADLSAVKPGDAVILHGCCHNPTGANLNDAQWGELGELLLSRQAVPLIDLAYQGFGEGLDEDARGVRKFASLFPELLIAASCSKNFGIYRERTGILIAVAPNARLRELAQGNLAFLNRNNFSFPPDHGARLVTMILNDPELRADWESELNEVRDNMLGLRRLLATELRRLSNSDRFAFIGAHRGMFSLLGATTEQVAYMRKENGIYMVADGRVNIAGLNRDSVPVLAQSMIDAGV